MQRPTFHAHTLLLASVVLLLQALFNVLHCAITIDWKAVIAGIYRAGIKARQAVYMSGLRFRATRIAFYRGRQRLAATVTNRKQALVTATQTRIATTQAQVILAKENFNHLTNTDRIFAEFAATTRTAAQGFRTEVIALANKE